MPPKTVTRPFYFVVLLGFFPTLLLAQENFTAGKIIRQSDTLSGFIDYRNWKRNPEQIVFKEHPQAAPRLIDPTAIDGFLVEGERYVSGVVQIDASSGPTVDPALAEEAEPVLRTDTLFLRVLIEGEKTLLFHMNQEKRQHFYIETAPQTYTLLIYRKYVRTVNGLRKLFENNRYRSQLASYLSGCPGFTPQVRDFVYDETRLRKLFERYYDCTATSPRYVHKREKVDWDFGVLSGVQVASLLGYGTDYLELANWRPSVDYTVAFFAEAILPRNRQKWSIYNELMLSSYSVSGTRETSITEYDRTVETTSFALSYLQLNTMARFRYPLRGARIFLNVGLSNGLLLRERNSVVREVTIQSTTTRHEAVRFPDMRKHEQGYIVGLGVLRKGFSLETRYQQGNGFSNATGYGVKTNRYFLLVGYRF